MKFDESHKTIFVLDHGPLFAQSSKQSIEHDVLMKAKVPGFIPAAPVTKSMWTCSVESMLEYIRVVYDIHPVLLNGNKLVQVITSDHRAHSLNSWQRGDQNMQQILMGLANIGAPESAQNADDHNVIHGLSRAIDVLCEPTDIQHAHRTSLTDQAHLVANNGRVICLTSLKSEAHNRLLEECVHDAITQSNQHVASTDNLMVLEHCELTLIHIIPCGEVSKVTSKPRRQVSPLLTSEVISTQSGYDVYYTIMTLVQTHYDLCSTTVTGIPMKEEQNASSSANYDVELLHAADVHLELNRTAEADGLIAQSREIPTTTTITLKWCTPKTNSVELHSNSCAQRITPVDVNSRPSSCLTNFLLSGRSVLLEQPCKAGVKLISHMLTSHGGEIFIHALNTSRSCLEDPPSISEGCGGRVTDYRITDFGKFMRENRLVPCAPPTGSEDPPVDKAFSCLERLTRKWPMTISDTIVHNMSSLQPLLSLIVGETMNAEDVRTCTMAIMDTLGMETRNEALPIGPLTSGRGKGPKRDEQYRQMWAELESLVRVHSMTSPSHQAVLDCLLQCRKPSEGGSTAPEEVDIKPMEVKDEKMEAEVDSACSELDRYQTMTVREQDDFNKADATSSKKFKPLMDPTMPKPPGGHNLLSLWTNQLNAVNSKRHCEFAGRLETIGNSAELYPHMNDDLNMKKEEITPTTSRSNTPNTVRS